MTSAVTMAGHSLHTENLDRFSNSFLLMSCLYGSMWWPENVDKGIGCHGEERRPVVLCCIEVHESKHPCQALTPDLCCFGLKEWREPVRAHTLEPIRA